MKRVFVSGGSGYIAMYCIKILLNKGYQVITSVRKQEKINLVKDSLSKNSINCLLYTSPSPRDATLSRMPSSA